jgi:hypothetical protein
MQMLLTPMTIIQLLRIVVKQMHDGRSVISFLESPYSNIMGGIKPSCKPQEVAVDHNKDGKAGGKKKRAMCKFILHSTQAGERTSIDDMRIFFRNEKLLEISC